MDLIVKDQIKLFLSNTFLIDFDNNIDDETNLFQAGFIDSYGFIKLVHYLENTYQIKVREEDLISDALTSIANIVNYLEEKQFEVR